LFYIPVLRCLSVCSLFKGVHHGTSPVNILYFNQYNPPPLILLTLSLLPLIIQQLLMWFVVHSSYTDAMYFNIIHYHSFLSLLPQSPQTAPLLITFHIYTCIYMIMFV
jgi:hypothetical protein